MIEMGIEIKRSILLEHGTQRRGDALRQGHRYPAADTDHFHVWNRMDPIQQVLEDAIRQNERITTRKNHIANSVIAGDIVDSFTLFTKSDGMMTVTNLALAGTEPAVTSAIVGSQQNHPVGIAVDNRRYRRVDFLRQRVDKTIRPKFQHIGNTLTPDRIVDSLN